MKILICGWHINDYREPGQYIRGLIEGISTVDFANQYVIIVPEDVSAVDTPPNIVFEKIRFPVLGRRFWDFFAHRWIKEYDIIHFPYDSFPLFARGKVIVTIRDLNPRLFSKGKGSINLNKTFCSLGRVQKFRRIDRVITNSNKSKEDLTGILGLPADKVDVVLLGVGEEFLKAERETEIVSKFNINSEYLLYVGGYDEVKNVKNIILSYAELTYELKKKYKLVLAGDIFRNKKLLSLIEQKKLSDYIILTGPVEEKELIQLYKNAALFIYLSLYEGFGLSVLEAMGCRVPVIVSNRSSLPEVVGNAGILVDPLNIVVIKKQLQRILSSQVLLEDLGRKGYERALNFTWNKTVGETIDSYKKVLLD
jgi:glycosyltransferase involved in cell wall biosynthesis